ncbi:MAG: iron-sulfur cluster assembly scaffold protein [Terracidiphilus sp.]
MVERLKRTPGNQARTHYNRHVYSPELLDHFQNPRNAGEVETPDRSVRLENPVCGDILELSLKLDDLPLDELKSDNSFENTNSGARRIADIRFHAKGCVPAIACGSAITELVKGKSLGEARKVSREDLVRKVGGLPPASDHASHLAIDTLAALLRDL